MTTPAGAPDAEPPASALEAGDVVQATVERWQPGQGGSVLRDDGTRLAFPPEAVLPPVRRLAPGQRVHLRVVQGRVTALTLWTLPLPPG